MNKTVNLLITLLFIVSNAQADFHEDINEHWYVGAGIVFSELEPLTAGTDFRVNDDSDTGFQIIIGNRIHSHFALEFSYADLGESGITQVSTGDTGSIKYEQITFGGVLYPWGGRKARRVGISSYWSWRS